MATTVTSCTSTSAAKPLVALHGSYYGYNFGDTLLCALFCRWLQQAGSEVVLPHANTHNQHLIGAEYRGKKATRKAMCAIFCGGGYFGEPAKHPWYWTCRNYLRHIRLAEYLLKAGTPLHILGIGAGPLSIGWFRRKVATIAQHATTLVVRDAASHHFFTHNAVHREMTIAADAALAITAQDIPQESHHWAAHMLPPQRPLLLVHFTQQGSHFDAKINILCDFLKKHPHVQPVIITDSLTRQSPFFPHRTSTQEKTANTLVQQMQRLPQPPVCVNYTGNPYHLCAILNQADIIITDKLHVGVVGTALHKYVIALPHHSKTQRFYQQLQQEEQCMPAQAWQAERFAQLLRQGLTPRKPSTERAKQRAALPYQRMICSIIKSEKATFNHEKDDVRHSE